MRRKRSIHYTSMTTIIILLSINACTIGSQSAPTEEAATSVPTSTVTPTPIPISTNVPTPTASLRINKTTSGRIAEDEIWEGEILITGDIFLDGRVTLTIKPGTTVYLAANSDDQQSGGGFDDAPTRENNDPVRLEEWHKNAISIVGIGGTIIAVGNPEERITFRPTGNDGSPAQWDGIEIESGTIQYADILYGGRVAINVLGEPTGVEIAHNQVRYFHWAGIDAHTSDVWFHHNIIEGGGHQSITCSNNSLIEHNIIIASNTAIRCAGTGGYVIRNNLILDSLLGIAIQRSVQEVEIYNNTIAEVSGPPNGFYYQDTLIYPAGFAGVGGIWNFGIGQTSIYNNIINVPGGCGIGIHAEPAPNSIVDFNLLWQNEIDDCALPLSNFGSANMRADPLFVDVQAWDFHLHPESPGVDAGNPDLLDPDGSPADLGIYGGPAGNGW